MFVFWFSCKTSITDSKRSNFLFEENFHFVNQTEETNLSSHCSMIKNKRFLLYILSITCPYYELSRLLQTMKTNNK